MSGGMACAEGSKHGGAFSMGWEEHLTALASWQDNPGVSLGTRTVGDAKKGKHALSKLWV